MSGTPATIDATPPQHAETPATTPKELALKLRREGLSYRQIGERLGVNPGTVNRWCIREIATTAQHLQVPLTPISRETIAKQIFEYAPIAVKNIQDLASSSTVKPDIRLRASVDMADRAGFAPVQRSVTLNVIEEMSRDQLAQGISQLANAIAQRASASQLEHASEPATAPLAHATSQPDAGQMGGDTPDLSTAPALDASLSPHLRCALSGEGGIADEKIIGGTTPDTSEQKKNLQVQAPIPVGTPILIKVCGMCHVLQKPENQACVHCGSDKLNEVKVAV